MAILPILSALLSILACPTQQGKNVAADQAPAQLLNAKSVFVSNLGEDSVDTFVPGGLSDNNADQPYNYLYTALQYWGRYQIVLDPADADLILEIRYRDVVQTPPLPPPNHKGTPPPTTYDPQLSLTIRDAKTGDVVKDFTEHIPAAILPSNKEKNFAQTIIDLLDDMAKSAGHAFTSFTLPKTIPAAPVPIKVLAAKKVFIAKPAADRVHGNPEEEERLYDQVTAATKTWGQYEMTATAEETDIIWEPSVHDTDLRMEIVDPKTHILLWGLFERVNLGITLSTAENQAAVKLLNHTSLISGKTIFGAGPAPEAIISPDTNVPIPITVSAPAKAKTGSSIRINVTVKNTGNFDLDFKYPSGDPLTCMVEVRDAQGKDVADTEQGRKLKAEHANWQGPPLSYTLNPGETQTRDCAVSDLFDMSAPGKYSIQVQQLDGRPVQSNVVTVTVGH